jgi:hypothetical protein
MLYIFFRVKSNGVMTPQIERAPVTSTFESLLDEDEEIQDLEEGEFYEDDAPAPAAAVSSARNIRFATSSIHMACLCRWLHSSSDSMQVTSSSCSSCSCFFIPPLKQQHSPTSSATAKPASSNAAARLCLLQVDESLRLTNLGLCAETVEALETKGIKALFPIQAQVSSAVLHCASLHWYLQLHMHSMALL